MRRYEFELWRGNWEQQIKNLQQWQRDHERDHDQDEDNEVAADREGRRERWRQFAAWMAVAAVLVAAWWGSAATR